MTSDGAPRTGWFISIEGPEGSGKTTQAERLRDALAEAGVAVVVAREPGGTAVGERLRELLLAHEPGAADLAATTDALLFNAARAQLVAETIRPALEAGRTVVCVRYADSTLAYQGYGAGLPLDDLRAVERLATGGLRPELTILLDLPVSIGLERKLDEQTRFEVSFEVAFHERVRRGFLALAAEEPGRFAIADATAPPDRVTAAIVAAVRARLPELPIAPGRRSSSRA